MDDKAVWIEKVALEPGSDDQELSATVDGERIWYRLPKDLQLVARPEPFLAPALFEAMVRGVPVRVEDDAPVSRRLLTGLSEIQAVLHCWNRDLHRVPVLAEESDDFPVSPAVACCFSGGIDSSYTYACHRDAVTHLMLVQGLASGRGGPDDWNENIAARRRFAELEGKALIAVQTNVARFLEERALSILLTHGGLLCGLGVGLSFKRFLIPASYTFQDLMPWGSHPMLDPLWATETTEVVHHGIDKTRIEKTAFVAGNQELLDQLQVCWYAGGRNCGACGKCVRTAMALHLLGVESRNLAPYRRLSQTKLLKEVNEGVFPFLSELIALAEKTGEAAIARRLRAYLRRYRFRKAASEMAREMIGASGRKLMRRLRPHPWHHARGTLQSIRTH